MRGKRGCVVALALLVSACSAGGSSEGQADGPEQRDRPTTTAERTTTSETTTTIPVEDLYAEMQAEIDRACAVAFEGDKPPVVDFDEERWGSISTEQNLLEATQMCIDIRIDDTTTTIDGRVSFLLNVGFAGTIDGETMSPGPAAGTSCAGTDGYADLAPGGTVTIADNSGAVLATVPLGAGTAEHTVKGTETERVDRVDLIDAIYDLRMARAYGDSVRVAELDLERWELHLYELEHPQDTPPPFEGHAFEAVWCNLPFTAERLPISPTYTVTVTSRGSTTHSVEDIEANDGTIDLTVG